MQEVIDLMEAYNENQKQDMKFKAICGYNSALVIAKELRTMFAKGEHEVMQINALYPSLFDSNELEENRQQEEAKKKEEQMKARLLAYASAWNKKIRREG